MQEFGGFPHTAYKLACVQQYLVSYPTIMKDQPFRLA